MHVHPLMNYFWQNCITESIQVETIYIAKMSHFTTQTIRQNINFMKNFQKDDWGEKKGVRGQRGSSPRLKKTIKPTE